MSNYFKYPIFSICNAARSRTSAEVPGTDLFDCYFAWVSKSSLGCQFYGTASSTGGSWAIKTTFVPLHRKPKGQHFYCCQQEFPLSFVHFALLISQDVVHSAVPVCMKCFRHVSSELAAFQISSYQKLPAFKLSILVTPKATI